MARPEMSHALFQQIYTDTLKSEAKALAQVVKMLYGPSSWFWERRDLLSLMSAARDLVEIDDLHYVRPLSRLIESGRVGVIAKIPTAGGGVRVAQSHDPSLVDWGYDQATQPYFWEVLARIANDLNISRLASPQE